MLTKLRHQAKTLLAILLLFFTQFIYFYLEADFSVDDRRFAIAELIFFYVFYTFSLLELFIPEAVWTVLGCVGLGVLRGYLISFSAANTTLFLAHLPICIFLLALDKKTKKPKENYGFLLTGVYPTLFLGYLIYASIRFSLGAENIIGAGINYGCFVFPALIVLYGVLRRIRVSKKEKNNREPGFMKDCFLFAILAITETFFMLRICNVSAMNFTVSLFWLMDLLILFRKGNPMLRSFFERFHIILNPED